MYHSLNELSERLTEWRQRRADDQLRRLARDRAIERFSSLHEFWYLSFFDRFFLERFAPTTLAKLDAETLAREWARQFRYRDERQRSVDVRQIIPVAEHFLCLFERAHAELLGDREKLGPKRPKRAGPIECPDAVVK